MKATTRALFFPFFFLALLSLTAGCVSVTLGPSQPGRAKDVRFASPPSPFQRLDNTAADMAWQSPRTGNTLSFFSECPPAEANLESLTEEFTSILRSAEIKERRSDFFNGRESLWAQTEGTLDGIPMRIASMVFKRNGCSYLLSFVGRKSRFKEEYAHFENFLKGFQAP